MWIDSHCHLTHHYITEQGTPEQLVNRAKENGVDGMVNICCRMSDEFPQIIDTARQFENVWCSVGTHPHDAGNENEQSVTIDQICKLANDPNVIGIGESGLDYYYDNSPRDEQQASFRKHIQACIKTGLPLIIHARDADEDIIRILQEEGAGTDLKGVMHCFSSGPQLAEYALEIGFYISFSGIVTFKKADELRAIALTVPKDRILVETDAPFLAPVPFRGKTNEPAYVKHTGEFLAEHLGMTSEDFANQTTNNFFSLFDTAQRPEA